jgi:rhodanese-related sulfurtransferase
MSKEELFMSSAVSRPPAAPSERALAHFEALLQVETDCWDVHHAMVNGLQDFVLVDVRSAEAFARHHLPGAVNLPHTRISAETLHAYPVDTLFVVYCAGPHCNGADKAAVRLAHLGRSVKKMLGGVCGWLDEGFELASGDGLP